MNLTNFKVGTRLGAGFFIVLYFLVAVTAVGIWNMKEIQARLDNVVGVNNVVNRLVIEMRTNVADRITSLRVPGSTIDLANPQARVGTTGFRGSGTSFSAPLVAGAAALLLEVRPSETPEQIKYALASTARPIGGSLAARGPVASTDSRSS